MWFSVAWHRKGCLNTFQITVSLSARAVMQILQLLLALEVANICQSITIISYVNRPWGSELVINVGGEKERNNSYLDSNISSHWQKHTNNSCTVSCTLSTRTAGSCPAAGRGVLFSYIYSPDTPATTEHSCQRISLYPIHDLAELTHKPNYAHIRCNALTAWLCGDTWAHIHL